ncbi:hypothetical protein [Planomicrobium okeanokoites]|uniref:hypothetical protein n=2 Tax=Caryophanaceae TaxID=186818 RepID=UPI000C7B1536|nr:hypothetical protein [Planomicrobium okeanokoites]PKH12154.1 hypothetical protein CXF70_01225 [Planomicrobium sp. MB-3u-38]
MYIVKTFKEEITLDAEKILKDLPLIEIIKRKSSFMQAQHSKYFDNTGELQAYNDMIQDVMNMTEDKFVRKYLKIVRDIEQKFNRNEITSQEEDHKLGGYSNAVVNVLLLIDPLYEEKLVFRAYCSDELIDRLKE